MRTWPYRIWIVAPIIAQTALNAEAVAWADGQDDDKTFGPGRLSPTGNLPVTHLIMSSAADAAIRARIKSRMDAIAVSSGLFAVLADDATRKASVVYRIASISVGDTIDTPKVLAALALQPIIIL